MLRTALVTAQAVAQHAVVPVDHAHLVVHHVADTKMDEECVVSTTHISFNKAEASLLEVPLALKGGVVMAV